MQWRCQLLQSVAKSRPEFYFVQRFAQRKNCETTHVTLCNSPATCLATALRDKLLRTLHSVTGPLVSVFLLNSLSGKYICKISTVCTLFGISRSVWKYHLDFAFLFPLDAFIRKAWIRHSLTGKCFITSSERLQV